MLGKFLRMVKKKDVSNKKSLDEMLHASHLSNEEKFNNILKFAGKILNDNISIHPKNQTTLHKRSM